MEPLFLTPTEAAVSLRLSRSKVYAMVKSKQLPSVKLEGKTRIPTDKLRAWARALVEAAQ